jgi:hypothetical protein
MNPEKYISELLFEHDCVIVPGFGGFVGNYSPAWIHPARHAFHPPRKTLLFNVNLKQNDGLLANRISACEGISFSDALKTINSVVEEWDTLLREGKTVTVEKVGRFSRSRDGAIQFEQDGTVNFLPESFGFSPLISPPVKRIGIQKKMERKITRYIESAGSSTRKIPGALKWAAILVLPIGIATVLGVMNAEKIKTLSQNYSGMFTSRSLPLHPKTRGIYQPGKTFSVSLRKEATLPRISHPAPVISGDLAAGEDPGANNPYAIIVGAFRFHENAVRLVAKLQEEGFNASIIDTTRTGLYRVCLQTYADRTEALRELGMIRSREFASAWLLQK